jgi:AraC-like DNA-binding protein
MTLDAGRTGSAAALDSEASRLEALRGELVLLLDRRTGLDGTHQTSIPGLKLHRSSHATEPAHFLYAPAVYVVVQGRKQVTLGDETYVYDRSQFLTASMDLPVIGSVAQASLEEPYLCITLDLDPRELGALVVGTRRQVARDDNNARALYVTPLRPSLLEGFLRLVRLLDNPEDIPVLAPLIMREINYRLLQSEQFGRLAQMAIADGRLRRVSGAIAWIKEHFAEPLQIEALAKQVHMSPSALHHHFKAVTALSPLQYQKRLRLQEARRLLLAGAPSAEVVAYEVGYASAPQFSREYARLFGQPPRRDAEQLRDRATRGARFT